MAAETLQRVGCSPDSAGQFPAKSCCGVGLDCIFWHKGKKTKLQTGFSIVSLYLFPSRPGSGLFSEKTLNCPIESSHHEAAHSTASESSLLFCYHQVSFISLPQSHLSSCSSKLNPSSANNLCLPPPQYSLSMELLEAPVCAACVCSKTVC